jgi:hypothetical protein
VARNNSKVADSSGSTFPASTVAHDLTRDPPAPRMGSWASSFSPRGPPLIQLLQEAVNWCLRRPLRVLGFDLKRAEIRALWLPIYRGFGLISKRIRSRSYFDPSIELVSVLVRINLKGKTPSATSSRWTRSGYRPRAGDIKSAGLRWANWWPAGPRAVEILWVAMRAAHRGENQSQARPVREFRPMANRKMRKTFYFSNLF